MKIFWILIWYRFLKFCGLKNINFVENVEESDKSIGSGDDEISKKGRFVEVEMKS